jgi:hypothetical protein
MLEFALPYIFAFASEQVLFHFCDLASSAIVLKACLS